MSKAIRVFGQEDQFLLNDGTVNAGGSMFIYQATTTTPLTTYQTSDTTGATNGASMTLDSAGRLQADVYITQAAKFLWKDSSGTQVGNTIDNIASVDQLWTTVSKSSNYTTTINDMYKTIVVDASGGTVTLALLPAATAGSGYIQVIKKTDSSANTIIIDPNGAETIDGSTTRTISFQNEAVMIMSTGTAWQTISTSIGNGLIITVDDASNSTVTRPVTIAHTTSGTAAIGIGTGITFQTENSAGTLIDAGAMEFATSNVTNPNEATYFDILLRIAGAALTKIWRWQATGAFKGIFSHANTADRTYTFPDTDISQHLVQYVKTFTGAVATGTTVIPFDDTIPQNTEGDQYMSVAIAPKSASNRLIIEASVILANTNTAAPAYIAALFQDSTANALAAVAHQNSAYTNASGIVTLKLVWEMAAGTTSATAFAIRAGCSAAGTTTFNGVGSARQFGGVLASHMIIYEVSP